MPSPVTRIGFVGLVVVACSSSSGSPVASGDAGSFGDAAESIDGRPPETSPVDARRSCYPAGESSCAVGETCCFSDEHGTCTDPARCASPVAVECWGPARCQPGEVCCGTIEPGFATPTSRPPGGASGDITMRIRCASTCAAPDLTLCGQDADCSGGVCDAVPEGGNDGLLAIAAEVMFACVAPDGGTL